MHHECVFILDFGSQVTQLIARRVRENGVYCEIVPCSKALEAISRRKPKAIILSGGPASVGQSGAPAVSPELFKLGVPVLGICYGQQLMCQMLGGGVAPAGEREFGRAEVTVMQPSPLFEGVWERGRAYPVWMSHGDRVEAIPQGFETIARTVSAPFAAIADERRQFYGVQFHPEAAHTPDGGALLRNFTHRIAGCRGDWTMGSFLADAVAAVRARVGGKTVLCGVSGGVDSTVVAALLHRAIGGQLKCIFVDTGLLRQGEAGQVVAMFAERLHIPLLHVDAGALFLSRLEGVGDPERKRKIIGETFIEVFEQESAQLGGADFLAQGTLYPDVIESVSFHGGPSSTIKSHHNVGGLPERMKMALVEPVRELFKDEVRALGAQLGVPAEMLARHPFPGPGLAIRIPGEVTPQKLECLRRADTIFLDEIRAAGLYDAIWQAFVVLLPVKAVGVMGDERSYEYACALRAVTASDGMTADFYPFAHEFLSRVAGRIVGEVRGINRVLYDVTSKPPGTIEWE